MAAPSLLLVLLSTLLFDSTSQFTFSSRLIHRFSDELKPFRHSSFPQKRTLDYYQLLVNCDFQRQRLKLGPKFQLLFPSQGSKTTSLGNDFGWLHYTWIDIGTPHASFLVALDAGSDLLWVPCDCVQCAPLSATYYGTLDRDLNEYSPSHSSTSKHLYCSHQLCELGPNCKSSKQPCPYTYDYDTDNTSTSGLLVEDILHLSSNGGDAKDFSVQAPVVIGCGMKQTGDYLDGVAPDGLMGLGLSEISVPSFLAKSGLIRNTFSMCFDEEDSGRILFGDQGPSTQHSTPFLTLDGNYTTYVVGVDAFCVGSSCLKQTSFRALVDTGSSFTFLPSGVYERVTKEFDRQMNAPPSSFDGYPWKYCYKASSNGSPKVPSVKFIFPMNNGFDIHNPVFMIYGIQGIIGFCLAIQPTEEDIGTIGQNFMTGYRMVFDRENLKLGWSRSNCEDQRNDKSMPVNSPNGTPGNPLPANEQQSAPGGRAVSPAVAGRAPSKPSAASFHSPPSRFRLFPHLLLLHLVVYFLK